MAAEGRQPAPAVTERPPLARLRERPWEFSFFQAIRLLQLAAREGRTIGSFLPPAAEPARLCASPSLSFPPSEVRALDLDGAPPRMTVSFFGLNGALGVLPLRYSEAVIERLQARDSTLRDFLDLFNHRLISLFYRAWERYRFPVAYERDGRDRFTGYMLALIGLGLPALENRQDIPDQALVYYAGLLARGSRSAAAFRIVLASFFRLPVEILEFAGSWRPLDPDCQTRLDDEFAPAQQLGGGMALGDEVWDQQSVVRVRLGPLDLDQYNDFLPGGAGHRRLRALARFFCGCDLDVELQLVLKREVAPRFGLGIEGAAAASVPQLGWVSWIFSRPLDRDPDETVIRLWED